MITTSIQMVADFHDAFDQPVARQPNIHDDALNDLRLDLLYEELVELRKALEARDEVATLDALTDLQYVLDGAYLSLGFSKFKDAAIREVHRSNMMKLGPNGKPIKRADGKVLKPEGWTPPNLKKILDGDDR